MESPAPVPTTMPAVLQLPNLEPQLEPISTQLNKATFQAGYRRAVVREGELLAAIENLRERLADSQHYGEGLASELTASSQEYDKTVNSFRRELQRVKEEKADIIRQAFDLRHISGTAARVLEQVVRNLDWVLTGWQAVEGDGAHATQVILQFGDWHISVGIGEASIWCEYITEPQSAQIDTKGLTASGLATLFGCVQFANMTADERARMSPALRAQIFVEPNKVTVSVPMGPPSIIRRNMSG